MERNCNVVLSDLSIGYRQHGGCRVVKEHINATIEAGLLTCLLGPNGAGKSTLLRTIAAFQPPLAGSIEIRRAGDEGMVLPAGGPDGKQGEGLAPLSRDLTSMSAAETAKTIGVVLTDRPDVPNMTGRELVALGRSPYTGFWGTLTADDNEITDRAIEAVGIGSLASRLVSTLSDGERQKVMIAKALAQQTPVICLDEPTAFLDYTSKVEILQLLRHIARQQQKTIFLSTHDLELALQLADCLWLLEPTEPVRVGSPKELAKKGELSRFIERPGIRFEEKEMSIKVKSEE